MSTFSILIGNKNQKLPEVSLNSAISTIDGCLFTEVFTCLYISACVSVCVYHLMGFEVENLDRFK